MSEAFDSKAGSAVSAAPAPSGMPKGAPPLPASGPPNPAGATRPTEWYYSHDGQQYGPCSDAELKQRVASGQVRPTDLVWHEGMDQWKSAGETGGLFAAQLPPPVTFLQQYPLLMKLWSNKLAFFSILFVLSLPLCWLHEVFIVLSLGLFVAAAMFLAKLLDDSIKKDTRRRLLNAKWESVDGNSPAIQFTEDGAMIRFDGFAAKYTLSGKSPDEVITIQVAGQTTELRVLTLSRDEMVLAGEGGACHYRRGVSISNAEAKRRAAEIMEKMKVIGKAAAVTAGAIGAGIAVLGVAAVAAGAGVASSAGGSGGKKMLGNWCCCNKCGMDIPPAASICPHCGSNDLAKSAVAKMI